MTPEDFLNEDDVSRETFEDFLHWEALLRQWNAKINLVAASTLNEFWLRHALDSWQLSQFVPETALTVLDMGSGAGFPGLSIAILLKHRQQGEVTLIESVGKKANFMRTVIRELGLPAKVINERVEKTPPRPYDIISARAFAPLDALLEYSQKFWSNETIGIFPKGREYASEIEEALQSWEFNYETYPSKTDNESVILKLTDLQPKNPKTK